MQQLKSTLLPFMALGLLTACVDATIDVTTDEQGQPVEGQATIQFTMLSPKQDESTASNLDNNPNNDAVSYSISQWGGQGESFDCNNSGIDQFGHSNGQMNGSNLAVINSPVNGDVISGSTVSFEHSAQAVWMYVGSEWGARDIYHGPTNGCNTTVSNLPTDGSHVYVVLWSEGDLYNKVYKYTTSAAGTEQTDANSSSSNTSTNASNTAQPESRPSNNDDTLDSSYSPEATSVRTDLSVESFNCHDSGVDQSGFSNGQMNGYDLPIINSPAKGDVIRGGSASFEHSSQAVWMYVGSEWGSRDLYHGPTSGCTTTVNGLPTDGSKIYVVLWSEDDLYAKVYKYQTAQ